MPAVLNTNTASLYASKNLQSAQTKMADSVERLSSGLRVNRASDDAAGLGIANALTTQINSANQGIRNLNDGISMVQTAEGAIAAAVDMAGDILVNKNFVTTTQANSGRAAALVNQVNDVSGDETQANQLLVIAAAKTYVDALTTQRSLLGAYQNQIEFTVSNVTELSANLAAAKSIVVDTDYAAETASLTKGQILQQAATAMLAQANQMPNVILSLLK